jgi:hypothetical protein
MPVKDIDGLEGNNPGDGGLQSDIAHWAEVLDRWVRRIDLRLGRQDGASPPPEDLDADPGAQP